MSEENRETRGIATHLPGIFQGLMANAIGGGLLPSVLRGYYHFFHHDAPKWVEGAGPNVAGAVILPLVYFSVRGGKLLARRRANRTVAAKGDRISILVALLGPDSESEREAVMNSLRVELGAFVEFIPAGVQLMRTPGVSDDVSLLKPTEEAHKLLRSKKADLLIWGKTHRIDGKTRIDLHFVAAERPDEGGVPKVFGVTEGMTLEGGFGPELGLALAGVAAQCAGPAGDSGRYVADVLLPIGDRLERASLHLPESMRGEDRATFNFSYALIQQAVGEQAGDSLRLGKAVAAYREALKEYTRERVPLYWAMTKSNLGNALSSLGERESGTERLDEAVAAYREALEERTRERVPLDWAMTQNNLGNALRTLGEREPGTGRLNEAVEAYRDALKEWTRERVPLNWATTQNNLGNALSSLGERESGTGRLDEAVAAYREALKERTRERVPLDWAMTQTNLGGALQMWGTRESGTGRLDEAVEAYRDALKERTRERVPLNWATTQNNLGNALSSLGERESGTGRLDEAVAAYREALKERTRERLPLDWATTQSNLGTALKILGGREPGTERLEEAVKACREALKERTRERVPLQWAMTQNNLGNALRSLGERESRTERLRRRW